MILRCCNMSWKKSLQSESFLEIQLVAVIGMCQTRREHPPWPPHSFPVHKSLVGDLVALVLLPQSHAAVDCHVVADIGVMSRIATDFLGRPLLSHNYLKLKPKN